MNTKFVAEIVFGALIMGIVTASVANSGMIFIFCLFIFLGLASVSVLMVYFKYLSFTSQE